MKAKLLAIIVLAYPWSGAIASVSGQAMAAAPCVEGGVNVSESIMGDCMSTPQADSDGLFMYGKGQTWIKPGVGVKGSYIGYWADYVPRAGRYMMRSYVCSAMSVTDRCTIDKSVAIIDTHYVTLESTNPIASQNPYFGGPARELQPMSTPTTMCIALVDDDGNTFASDDPTSCNDAAPLPDHPVRCSIAPAVLDVSVPVVRGSIETTATAKGGVQKQIGVTCEGDSSATYDISLTTASPLTIGDDSAIGTTTKGLGIAMFYNDSILSPGSDLIAQFKPGTTQITLRFVPVRDPLVPAKDIATGDFSADAVLIMTEQ